MDTKQRILQHATDLFSKLGVKSVSTDRLVSDLGISKKTLYQLFANKSILVREVCTSIITSEEGTCWKIIEASENAIDELVQIMRHAVQLFQKVSPSMIHEIRKYYPDSWEIVEAHHHDFILDLVKKNLQRGIDENLYRPSINVDIVSRVRVNSIIQGFDSNIFPEAHNNLVGFHTQLFELYLYGIATEKGRKLIQKYLTHETYSTTHVSPS